MPVPSTVYFVIQGGPRKVDELLNSVIIERKKYYIYVKTLYTVHP